MEINYPAIATGVVRRLGENSMVWSPEVTHVLENPIGVIGLAASPTVQMKLQAIEGGLIPAMITGAYTHAGNIHITVEDVMSMEVPSPGSHGVFRDWDIA